MVDELIVLSQVEETPSIDANRACVGRLLPLPDPIRQEVQNRYGL
jgi:hypothetical protein